MDTTVTIYVIERDNPNTRPEPEIVTDRHRAFEIVEKEFHDAIVYVGDKNCETYWNLDEKSGVGDILVEDRSRNCERYEWRVTEHEIRLAVDVKIKIKKTEVEIMQDARTETYELIEAGDYDGIFTVSRIDSATVPEGLYRYEVRYADDDERIGRSVEMSVGVNFLGTILSKEEIPMDNNGMYVMFEEGMNYTGIELGLEEFMKTDDLESLKE